MKRAIGCAVLCALLGVGVLSLAGCKEKGPMEKAGAKVDDAAKKGADKAAEATKKLDEATKKGG